MHKKFKKNFLVYRKLSSRIIKTGPIVLINNAIIKYQKYFKKNIDKRYDEYNNQIIDEKFRINFSKFIVKKESIALVAMPNDKVNYYFKRTCEDLDLPFEIFNPLDAEFINNIKSANSKKLLVRLPHKTSFIRQSMMEKLEILSQYTDKLIYPSIKELRIYESKRSLSYFLKVNDIPHPETWVFLNKKDAIEFLKSANFPLMLKTNTGAGSSGVEFISDEKNGLKYINIFFDRYYLNKSVSDYRDIDYGYVLFQQYIDNPREFRIIKVGDSWMGHEKIIGNNGNFMSGSGAKSWAIPDKEVFKFCKNISDRMNFNTMCFDVFQDKNDGLYVNELQTWFGHTHTSQMYLDNSPGRFVFDNQEFVFEVGDFNYNQSIPLRIIDMLKQE